ncbi:type II secretion system F family protein [Robbsia sp. Bb-Pol-6]|uniref:Type II secretion system F family protein n=1 Tax=Robbsia betulipollinis TaxID=2981849 RepID=A0ABT3ZNQ3_9BURK|nr:type II secretion system F family protein [Robbsia betulipollinis]MCY0388169.1 type II secretion system F family protein [Robbsia betulipollinis]
MTLFFEWFVSPRHACLALALLAAAAASLVLGMGLIRRARMQTRQARRLDQAVAARAGRVLERRRSNGWRVWIAQLGARGVASALGRSLVAGEDRLLLDQCAVNHPAGQAWFFLARTVLGFGMPALGLVVVPHDTVLESCGIVFFGFGTGYMVPKWVMRRRAAARRRHADEEMPLLVDLLRLLQGVGLSVDQTIQLIEQDFGTAMPVLSSELAHAEAQFRSGLPRAASLQRFATIYRNADMASVAELIVQVDRFGGAVQTPLQQFGERMRERRRSDMKARIGQLTVKMTGVMVLTLLPALIVVTGGAGFLAIFRSLSRMGGG